MADYDLGDPDAAVSTTGPHGETLGPFKADKDGVAHVPDDLKNAVQRLDGEGFKRAKPKTKSKAKE